MADKSCAHEGCTCEPRDDGFCSDYCARHATKEGHVAHACDCGHAGCGGEASAA